MLIGDTWLNKLLTYLLTYLLNIGQTVCPPHQLRPQLLVLKSSVAQVCSVYILELKREKNFLISYSCLRLERLLFRSHPSLASLVNTGGQGLGGGGGVGDSRHKEMYGNLMTVINNRICHEIQNKRVIPVSWGPLYPLCWSKAATTIISGRSFPVFPRRADTTGNFDHL